MKTEWKNLKKVKGCALMGIYANQLDVIYINKEQKFHPTEPVLKLVDVNSHDFWYWKLSWSETDEGDDFLMIEEQETPEPLKYTYEPDITPHQLLVFASYISLDNNLIKNVSGYGFKDEDYEILTSLVFELEENFVSIITGPAIEVKIKEKEPNGLGQLIFTL